MGEGEVVDPGKDGLEEDLRKLGVTGWRRKAEYREEWRHVVKKAEALHGL
jgi:hypothetical protein